MFGLWHRAAGKPRENAGLGIPNVTPIVFRTRDGITLRGYKISSALEPSKASLLVAQGNALLAEQTLALLRQFAQAGIDSYVFDFRGYGKSEGVSRLSAIVGDYEELTTNLVETTSGPHVLYGFSFGGIILLDAAGTNHDIARIVVDSTPSRLSTHGCPINYDAVANVSGIGSRLLIIAGGHDRVVTPEMSRELMDKAPRGASVRATAQRRA